MGSKDVTTCTMNTVAQSKRTKVMLCKVRPSLTINVCESTRDNPFLPNADSTSFLPLVSSPYYQNHITFTILLTIIHLVARRLNQLSFLLVQTPDGFTCLTNNIKRELDC